VAGVHPADGLPAVPPACFAAFASEPFASLLRFIAAAPPPGRIQPDVNAPTKRRMRPIHRVRHETVLDWVEMRVVHVNREAAIIAGRVLSAMRATSKFDRRSSRFTVSKNVPPGTRLAGLGERRNALRGWARILQGWKNVVRPSRPRFARHLRMRYFS
jgi:hypothetical protein